MKCVAPKHFLSQSLHLFPPAHKSELQFLGESRLSAFGPRFVSASRRPMQRAKSGFRAALGSAPAA